MFTIGPDTPTREHDGVVIVSGPGGCQWVTDPERPHLGGNFDGGDLGTMYPDDLWPWLIETFEVKSMADVGCGTGETLRWFEGKGVKTVGVDGLPWNVQQCGKRCSAKVALHDFTVDGPYPFDAVDLVWCADVVEHIAEEHADAILATIRQGSVLAMCHGTEAHAELGWHHVNNKSERYWVDRLAAVGMVEDAALTRESRGIGNHGWWQATGRIYRKCATPDKPTKADK